MGGREVFRQKFDALDVSTRAALVFRYREGLPLAHVAQLVDRPVRKLGPLLERTLEEFREAGALAGAGDGGLVEGGELAGVGDGELAEGGELAGVGDGELAEDGDLVEAVRGELEELRGDPALTSFSLVSAVRAEQNRRGLFRGLRWGRMMRRVA